MKPPITIAQFPSLLARQPQPKEFTSFGEFAAWLAHPIVADSKHAIPLWSPVTYAEGATRGTPTEDAILTVNAGAFDVDHLPLEQVDGLIARIAATGIEAVVYTSHSHRSCGDKCKGADDAHLRVVLAFDQPVPVALWGRVWRALVATYIPEADPQAKDAKRLLYNYSYPEARTDVALFRHLNPTTSSTEVCHVTESTRAA